MKKSFFTLNSLISVVDLDNKIEKSLKTRNVFHSQFQLDTESYRDNNNYNRNISGTNSYNRFNPFKQEEEFTGLDFTSGPLWNGASFDFLKNVSKDGGKTFKEENHH